MNKVWHVPLRSLLFAAALAGLIAFCGTVSAYADEETGTGEAPETTALSPAAEQNEEDLAENEDTQEAVTADPVTIPEPAAQSAPPLDGVVNEGGVLHYYKNGALQRGGWIAHGALWYYAQADGALYADTIRSIGGREFAFAGDGIMHSGLFSFHGQAYLTDGDGALCKGGWRSSGGRWFCARSDGRLYADGVYHLDAAYYGFDASGTMLQELFRLNGRSYVADGSGAIVRNAWCYCGGRWYYGLSDGTLFADGIRSIDGQLYGFDENGAMKIALFSLAGNTYLATSSGALVRSGWCQYGSNWYCARSNGALYADGVYALDGACYAFAENGTMLSGTFSRDEGRYVTNEKGEVQCGGWKWIGGRWYYAQADGVLYADGFRRVEGSEYAFDAVGAMFLGIFRFGGELYLTDSSGVVQKGGWKPYGADWCYADASGVLIAGRWFTDKDKRVYYAQDDGIFARNRFLYLDEKHCFFNENCVYMPEIPFTGSSLLDIARSQIGISEGSKFWNYLFNYAYQNGTATPWCGCFVAWCFNQAGQLYKLSGLAAKALVPAYSAWASAGGKWVAMPQPGDLVVFHTAQYPNGSHIGIVESVVGDAFYTIEGNTGTSWHGEVKRNLHKFADSYVYGFIHV